MSVPPVGLIIKATNPEPQSSNAVSAISQLKLENNSLSAPYELSLHSDLTCKLENSEIPRPLDEKLASYLPVKIKIEDLA
ncbi:unnamed protein product [Protopolystoma xenopodis]|uniref:Uncharacterized protein n=1 Tax=Protopolystoma xenopodis TaxID=117903 RepID=A0A448WM76_9PLAT|nr:unnamed protein product [Protopolystoma xenopodis]